MLHKDSRKATYHQIKNIKVQKLHLYTVSMITVHKICRNSTLLNLVIHFTSARAFFMHDQSIDIIHKNKDTLIVMHNADYKSTHKMLQLHK